MNDTANSVNTESDSARQGGGVGRFEADEDVVSDRTPAACPFCGHDGVFDGQGTWPDEITTVRSGVRAEYDVQWSQHRCPECNGTFQMLDSAEQVRAEVRGL